MSGDRADRIERGLDAVAAVAVGIAVAACALRLSLSWVASAAAALAALCGTLTALRAVRPGAQRYRISDFGLPDITLPPEELVLSDEHRADAAPAPATAELILDDVLAELAPDSRVVRLFDRAAMPTPGELSARIDRHLNAARRPASSPDASDALHEALSDLRRSLR